MASGDKTRLLIGAGLGCMLLVVLLMLTALYLLARAPSFERDGGLEIRVSVDTTDPSVRDATGRVLLGRLEAVGARGATVSPDGPDYIVRVPGIEQEIGLHDLLTRRGLLEFCEVVQETPMEFGRCIKLGDKVAGARVDTDQFGEPHVELEFDGAGRDAFCELSTALVGRKMSILVDGDVQSSPVVQEPICGGVAWVTLGTGQPDEQMAQEAADLAAILGTTPLPAATGMVSERAIEPGG